MSDRNIRWGRVVKESDDKGPYKLHTVEHDGKQEDMQAVECYGVQGNAYDECQCIVLVPDGDEGKAVALIMPPPAKRTDGQKKGEVSYVNHETGNVIKHEANGDTTIKTAGILHINP